MVRKSWITGVCMVALLMAGVVNADAKKVKPLFEERFPGAKVESVVKEPLTGLYEVYAAGQIFYTDEKVTYVIQGSLVDAKNRKNLTNERLKKFTEIPFDKLPFEQSIKIVKGNGTRKLAIFEDPECPFCKQLEKELQKVDDVTVYVFLYPIEQLHPGATAKSMKIWCAPDRAKAWLSAVHDGIVPDARADCENPIAKLAEFGRSHRITGTPTMMFENGNRIAGAVAADRLEKLLGENISKQ